MAICMEMPETVSVRKFREFGARQKQELYETLLELAESIDELPKKSLRKTLELTLAVLAYKGAQVDELQNKLPLGGASERRGSERRLYDENEKLKRMLQKLEEERDGYKEKIKELADEILQLQKRLQEAEQQAEASDKDSSDPLSELEKHEKLLQNIDTKNKHIKRLLREIETLQNQNIAQSKTIVLHEQELQHIKTNLIQLSQDITQVEQERKKLKQREREQGLEITRLEGNITFLEDEREKQELEMRQFIEKYESKSLSWNQLLEQKEKQLKSLQSQLDKATGISSVLPAIHSDSTSSIQSNEEEQTKLRHLLELREQRIETLEAKVKTMADEMVSSTKVMNRMCAERERCQDPAQPRACCKLIEESLRVANARSQQLSELLESTEQDNVLKSKQALHAINALEAYKRGEDGLVPALRKCSALEQKLAEQNKQLRSYVHELNAMHELAQENSLLRRRLNIPDDVVVLVKNSRAKERNKDKLIERLTLKLRTSEELRLQLKLDKSELRRKLLELQQQLRLPKSPESSILVPIEPAKQPSEMGEVPSSAPLLSPLCNGVPSRGQGDGAAASELQTKYEEVLAENESLRVGMYEILEKLREYDATSEHITIDSELLRRLMDMLPSIDTTPKRLHSELLALKAREEALRQLLQQNGSDSETGELSSVHSMRDVPEMPREDEPESSEEIIIIDTATRPTTPNESADILQLPVIAQEEQEQEEEEAVGSTQVRELQQQLTELHTYRKHYEELKLHMAADGNELKRYNQQLHEKTIALELRLHQQNNSYEFMREDYDRLLHQMKQHELRYINDTAALSRQLEERNTQLQALQAELELQQRVRLYSSEEVQRLEQKNSTLSMQLAHCLEEVLGGRVNTLKLPEICADYGIIGDNYQLDYITAAEYEEQLAILATWREKQAELQRQNKQLEGLLEVANGQIQSQQKLLNEITDNHISLRHLVADLQSSSEEKLLVAKMQRDLDSAKMELTRIETERNELRLSVDSLQEQLLKAQRLTAEAQQDFQIERRNRDIKHKFLQKSLFTLKEKYAKFTPLIFLTNFVFAYNKFMQRVEQQGNNFSLTNEQLEQVEKAVESQLAANASTNNEDSQQLIKLIKAETQVRLLEQSCESLQLKNAELQRELVELRLRHATESEHWQTIEALFGVTHEHGIGSEVRHIATNTEMQVPDPAVRRTAAQQLTDRQTSPISSPNKKAEHISTQTTIDKPLELLETAVQTNRLQSLQHQAVQTAAIEEAEQRSESKAEVQEIQTALLAAQKRIEELQSQLKSDQVSKTDESANTSGTTETSTVDTHQSGVVEKTILSFHTLLLEKDNSIQKYQDLLQTEREQSQQLSSKLNAENETLKATVNNLNFNIKTKDVEILELKAKLDVQITTRHLKPKDGQEHVTSTESDESVDNSLNELTDEKIEEMFEDTTSVDKQEVVTVPVSPRNDGEKEKQDTEELKEVSTLHKQIKELKEKLVFNEQSIKTREEEIEILKEKLKMCQEREKAIESTNNPEVEQLRVFLEEKDKHIKDLMETLKNFHDDQQRYINDTSNFSAEQIAKLAADLNRTEATNKIYHTQMEALRRQVSNLTQREKQARDLSQSLRNQLIKRPVLSVKTEQNARVKNENLQKRVQQLELDLEDARAQVHRQQMQLDAKRTRSANEVGLWEKQKRWQQNAEKYKAKLDETETALEKTRSLLRAARTTIARLEKDKHMLEVKLNRAGHTGGASQNTLKCCRTPSCPNLQHVGAKFTPSPSESPETYTGPSSECSSPAHNAQPNSRFYDQSQLDLVEALKARIELQQRKIIAMELEGRGSNALTTELEKLQERYQAIEAQNIRLEARNLQLQLDTDLLRQGDTSERLQKRIKHLEDYIMALKEEMARTESRRDLCKCSGIKVNTQQGQSAEHTILSLRNLVEKLRSENKFLKDGRRSTESRSSTDSSASGSALELARIQQLHAEALEKISALQMELNQRNKCSQCSGRSKDATNEELKYIKEQLVKKTQLLQKAKVLLTRAAAKEKVLKEQLALWKRKCSELQNVPVIDEISE
ncbi:centrosomal protein cep290 [Scaptodrosophila lebanonensis]|uniref:Centrosomal protein cep290 n=1 Tax=Drosophila lebanonensis TaxID=7225 RepID=A0A6J2TA46_DROLE|nr:centrosomal protein cep290 [Scaptodrosophila lebanonensis]